MGGCESINGTRISEPKNKYESNTTTDKTNDLKYEQETIIKNQKESSICVVEYKQNNGTAFLCLIPISKNKSNQLHALVTNNHVIDFKGGNEIKLTFRDRNIERKIKIDDGRKLYTDEVYDITIIEIKEEDQLSQFNFLEIDEKILKEEELEKIYLGEMIYIIHYPQASFSTCSYDKIKQILNNSNIRYTCQTQPGSSGSPILNLKNYKVIGIHCGFHSNYNVNIGNFLREPLIKFEMIKDKDNKKQNKREINITLDIREDDINKDIYFLDNSYFDIKTGKKNPHSFLPEFKDSKVKLFINGKQEKKFQKYFRPETKGIYKIRLGINTPITDCRSMFEFCDNITEIDLSSFDISEVVNMSCMFKDCVRLEKLDLSCFLTVIVKYMDYMFSNCSNLKVIDLAYFNTKNVVNMGNMFRNCNKIEELNLKNFDTRNVNNMNNMFSECSNLTYLNLTSFDTSNVTDMSGMFSKCSKLKKIEFSTSFNTESVTTMKQMFCECNCLKSVNCEFFNTKNVIDMSEMFSECNSLTFLDLTNFDTRKVENMKMMFNKCHDLLIVRFNRSTFVNDNVKDMTKMFSGCRSWKNLNFSHFHLKGKKCDNFLEGTSLSLYLKSA